MVFKSQKRTIEAFVNNECESGQSKDGRVWFEEGVLYSFDKHFPLAVRYNNGFFAINDTPYSKNTRKHQDIIQDLTRGNNINIVMPTRDITLDEFLDAVDLSLAK